MAGYCFRRLLMALSVALTVSIVCFMLLHLSGDLATAIAGPEASAEQVEKIRIQFGLNQPIFYQYLTWLWSALHLDFGQSFFYQDPVISLIYERIPVTLTLGAIALGVATCVAIPLGILAAIKQDSWLDRLALMIAVFGQAMPSFWFGLALMLIFAVNLHWLPAGGTGTWQHYVLPAIALGYYATPSIMRLTRTGMLEVLNMDYIRTARSKGISTFSVIFKHALRNAVVPVIALLAVELGFMLGGSVVIESVFSLKGMGQLAWDAIARNDYPVVQAIVLLIAIFYIALTFLADLLNPFLDPRLRIN